MQRMKPSTGPRQHRGAVLGKVLFALTLLLLCSAIAIASFLWRQPVAVPAQAHKSIAFELADDRVVLKQTSGGQAVTDSNYERQPDLSSTADAIEEAPVPTGPQHLLEPEQLSEASAHLCFFSLNNPWEYRRMRWFTNAINKHSPIKIKVSEFQMMDADPVESFMQVLRTGVRCDGIVLSGHFTDEYYGDRADGDLTLEDLEELSCKPGFSEWFSQVNALWLQGCNTIKNSDKNKDVDDDDRVSGSPLGLMSKMVDPSDMEDTIEDMYDLLMENTNEDNFAVHFQRIFPQATVYGWTNTAPGEKAGSDRSLPYHIAQSSRVVDSDPRVFSNPITNDIPADAARRYTEILYGMLKRPLTPRDDFPAQLSEKNFIQAWKDHGSHRYRYAFDNPSVRGYSALSESKDEVLRQVKGLACLLHQIDDMEDTPNLSQLTRHILKDRHLYEYSSYTLEALSRRSGPQLRNQIYSRMRNTDGFMRYLERARSAAGYRGKDAQRLYKRLQPATAKVETPVTQAATNND